MIGGAVEARAQTAAPQHEHYDTPAGFDAAPAPGKPLAPRLQNLGVHTFPVSTKRAQRFVNHRPESRLSWEDLKKNPEQGWSLFGLKQSLEAQGKKDDAAQVEARFQKAWKDADLVLTSARVK